MGAVLLQGDALATQAQVMGQQFLQRQTPLRRMGAGRKCGQISIARGPMHGEQRLAQGRQLQRAQQVLGQQFQRGLVGQPIQRLGNQLAQDRRRHAFDRRIDRLQRVGQRRLASGADQLVVRMDDLQALLARARYAVDADPRARRELPDLRGAEMEEAQHQRAARVIADGHAQHRPIAEATLDRLDRAFHLRRHAGPQLGDGREPGAVPVAQRQLQPQVLQGRKAARGEFSAIFGPTPDRLVMG